MSLFLYLCSPSFFAKVSPMQYWKEHMWGPTCSVLIPLSPSAWGLESLQPLELGLKALILAVTSDPGNVTPPW